MDFLIILIDLVVIALGIVDVRFGFICRREQHQNKMNAEILVFVDDMDKMKAKLQQADMLS